MHHLTALGYGYCAKAITAALLSQDWTVTGSSRTAPRIENGIDILSLETVITQKISHIIVSAPPNVNGDPILQLLRDQMRALPNLKWIGYLSTIGVYGNHNGAWVTEESETLTKNQRSLWRIKAENQWLAFAHAQQVPCQIFRLSGIYGPERNALVRILSGRAQSVIKPNQVFNRIHVEDIAQIVIAGIKMPHAGPIFNLADDEPAPPQDVIAYAAELLKSPPPQEVPFDEAILSPMAQSFYTENKRVSNLKIKKKLGVTLKYPTYRSGLRELLQHFKDHI